MLTQALLATAEHGLNRVLKLDSTALPRLAALRGKVIAIDCQAPQLSLYLLPDGEGVRLASDWQAAADCRLQAPASSLVQLLLSTEKTAILHQPQVELLGDAQPLMELASVLQDLNLDWEHELSLWLGPVAAGLLGSQVRSAARWGSNSVNSLRLNFIDYLSEESRTLVGQREAQARFAELDELKLRLDRLEARCARLTRKSDPSENA